LLKALSILNTILEKELCCGLFIHGLLLDHQGDDIPQRKTDSQSVFTVFVKVTREKLEIVGPTF